MINIQANHACYINNSTDKYSRLSGEFNDEFTYEFNYV